MSCDHGAFWQGLHAAVTCANSLRLDIIESYNAVPQLLLTLHVCTDKDCRVLVTQSFGPMQALECGLLQAILTGIQSITAQPSSRLRQDQDTQQLISLLVAMLSQLTMEKSDQAPIHTAVSQGGVKLLRSLFDVIASEGGQQNLVSMLWHWSTCTEDIRQQVMGIGMPELQVSLLGLQHSPVQRQTAADQLSAYVSFPTQQEDSNQKPDSRLAADLVHAGAPMQLIEMLSSRYHDQVRCSAAQAICTLATFSPKSKMNIIAAGAYHPVVAMLQRSESPAVKEAGCHLTVTLATGDPGAGPIFTQPEAAVQFAAIGAISALADMLRPVNKPSTRITAILVLHVMANAYEDRVQKALVSAQVVPLFLELLRVLSGRLPWDTSLDALEQPTIEGMKLKSAEILAMVAINNQAHTRLLVDTGAIPELVVVAAGSEVPEEDREQLLRLLHHLCKSDGDVLAILTAMMGET